MTRAPEANSRDALADLACACASARQAARLLTQLYDRHLRGAGLEAPQFALLMALKQHGPCSQITLGRRHGLDKTTVCRGICGGWKHEGGSPRPRLPIGAPACSRSPRTGGGTSPRRCRGGRRRRRSCDRG